MDDDRERQPIPRWHYAVVLAGCVIGLLGHFFLTDS